jgi:hypothetical protein
MKLALALLLALPLSAVPPPSLAGVVAVVVGIADHPKLIIRGLRATGRTVARPFHHSKKVRRKIP